MKTCILFSMLAFGTCVYAQDYTSSIVAITGASEAEELDESVLERFESMSRHPVNINTAPRSRLLSCGLFSAYQVSVITDYRSREGDILSYSELASLGGFDHEKVFALKPFISLASNALPGQSSLERKSSADFIAKGSFRQEKDKDSQWSAGVKFRYELQDRYLLSLAYRDELSVTMARYWRGGKLVIGDYNARFGQGLAMWSGFSLSGLSSVSAFARRGTGVSPSWTFSPSSMCRGVAVEQEWGHICLTLLSSFRNGTVAPGANLRWYGSRSQIGITMADSGEGRWKTAVDAGLNVRRWDLFAEGAYDYAGSCIAFTGGGIWNIGYDVKIALQGRLYPEPFGSTMTGAVHSWSKTSDECGLSAGVQLHKLTVTLDGAFKPSKDTHQFKLLALRSFKIGENLSLNLRLSERYRPLDELAFRTDARADLKWENGSWMAQTRMNMLKCRGLGTLAYVEGGRTGTKLKMYARATYFNIKNWDDRIYAYERDAPGSFNVPAYYGHGYSLSLFGSWNRHWYMRTALLVSDRAVKYDVRLQYSYDFFHLNASGTLDKDRSSFKDILGKVFGKSV